MHECASRISNTPNSMVFWLAYNSTHAKMSMMSSACDKRLVHESCGFLRAEGSGRLQQVRWV